MFARYSRHVFLDFFVVFVCSRCVGTYVSFSSRRQADEKEPDQKTEAQGPAEMLWSLIRWLEQELPDVRTAGDGDECHLHIPILYLVLIV